MTKEKTESLNKYIVQLKQRLTSPTPNKHAHAPGEYKAFLEREIRVTQMKLDEAKIK